jgi:hypothetical protein
MSHSAPKTDSAQDTTARAPQDSTTATTAIPLPQMRTPENGGFLQLGYLAASTIYISYLVIMYRRWSALRSRQKNGFTNSGR